MDSKSITLLVYMAFWIKKHNKIKHTIIYQSLLYMLRSHCCQGCKDKAYNYVIEPQKKFMWIL